MTCGMDTILALCSTALTDPGSVPDWVQLMPAGEFTGADGRGPYLASDLQSIIDASMKPGRKLPIDEMHAIDLNATTGAPAPARGWIVEMQARADGIWGRVEWTPTGRALMEDKAYGFISPALQVTKAKPHRVRMISRASLVNDPNLTMKSLHNRKDLSMDKELAEALGLADGATAADAVAAVKELKAGSTALQTSLNAAKKALDLGEDADGDALVRALNAKLTAKLDASAAGGGGDKAALIAALQNQVSGLADQLTTLTQTHGKARAEQVVDAAIADTRLVPALRDHFISRHMKDPGSVEKELAAFPRINAGGVSKPPMQTGSGTLDEADQQIVSLMGVDPEAFAKTKADVMKELG